MAAYEELTARQRRFVDAYVGQCNCNASAAARAAGYRDPGQAGYENKKKQEVQAAIDERMRELSIGPEEILFRLTEHARGNILDVAEEDGRLPDRLNGLTRQQAALIRKHSVRPGKFGDAVSVEIHDAQAALLALAKRYELFPEAVNQNVSGVVGYEVLPPAAPGSGESDPGA